MGNQVELKEEIFCLLMNGPHTIKQLSSILDVSMGEIIESCRSIRDDDGDAEEIDGKWRLTT